MQAMKFLNRFSSYSSRENSSSQGSRKYARGSEQLYILVPIRLASWLIFPGRVAKLVCSTLSFPGGGPQGDGGGSHAASRRP